MCKAYRVLTVYGRLLSAYFSPGCNCPRQGKYRSYLWGNHPLEKRHFHGKKSEKGKRFRRLFYRSMAYAAQAQICQQVGFWMGFVGAQGGLAAPRPCPRWTPSQKIQASRTLIAQAWLKFSAVGSTRLNTAPYRLRIMLRRCGAAFYGGTYLA